MTVLRALLAPWLWLGLASLALAAGSGDHERAWAAVQAGEVMPLPQLLAQLQQRYPGQVLELELERKAERWVYEIRLLQAQGQLLKVELDARDARILHVTPRGRHPTAPGARMAPSPALRHEDPAR